MTLTLGRQASIPIPRYRTGCKPGHRPLEFRRGTCFKCGRENPPVFQLDPEDLARVARRKVARAHDGWSLLDEAVAQNALKLRALALLQDVDIENAKQYRGWLRINEQATETLDKRLRKYDEDEVRWAIKAAYV